VIQKQAEAHDVSYETVKEEEYTGDLALGEMVTPEEVADTAVYLASDHGEHITAQDINVDSGKTWY
jgi:enoyl-[acyl-carrier-protein] reductase (NADH)